ncbi:CsoS2 family carboxysome shell protein [Thiohalocapsa marina]|nr:CsoS2 family carboxysome shell protein [Thiohalocapsa marina]
MRPSTTSNAATNRASTRLRRNAGPVSPGSTSRLVARARRTAMASRGKAAADTPTSAAGLARQANPRLSSRELAQKVREHRSRNGASGERKTQSAGRARAERRRGAADQPWKVGASETLRGQTVTGTEVSRSPKTTGNEQATCRTITGTEYMGAEIFREFCQTEPAPTSAPKVAVTDTRHGNAVTGSAVGRSVKVTGDEPGSCSSVTGTEYLAADHFGAFCQNRPGSVSGRAPISSPVTGRPEGASRITGGSQGAGVRPTGTRYTDVQSIHNGSLEPIAQQVTRPAAQAATRQVASPAARPLAAMAVAPAPARAMAAPMSARSYVRPDARPETSLDARSLETGSARPARAITGSGAGMARMSQPGGVTGTRVGRSARVTGDEPGTCTAVTGTPYWGLEQASNWCAPELRDEMARRRWRPAPTPGARLTGIQPGVGGRATGDARGACEPISGTPYIGRDQYAQACGDGGHLLSGDAETSPMADVPEATGLALLESATTPGTNQLAEAGALHHPHSEQAWQQAQVRSAVTGTRYETGSQITGPFDMGGSKITGTEQFRFDARQPMPPAAAMAEDTGTGAAERPRITGEGQTAGAKITGDDWERGDRVTGTEGHFARRRNPSRPGPMGAMPAVTHKRNEAMPEPVSRVTGSSGSTERGALITYSGGARG